MSIPLMALNSRLNQFCDDYRVPKKFHGSIAMLAHMAFVLGFELTPHSIPRMRPSDVGLDRELFPMTDHPSPSQPTGSDTPMEAENG